MLLLEAGPDYPDPNYLPDDVKFGHTRAGESEDSIHNWALRGTITEEQGEIHVAQGKVIGGSKTGGLCPLTMLCEARERLSYEFCCH